MPFACLRLVNPTMSITAGLGILRLSVAAGDVAVLDTRQPSRTRYPVVLHAGPMRCGNVPALMLFKYTIVFACSPSQLHGSAASKHRFGRPFDLCNSFFFRFNFLSLGCRRWVLMGRVNRSAARGAPLQYNF